MNGVGFSEVTKYKQNILKEVLRKHLIVVEQISKNFLSKYGHANVRYLYVDATSGPGLYRDDCGEMIRGSPMQFLDAFIEVHPRIGQSEIFFIDKDKSNLMELTENVKSYDYQFGMIGFKPQIYFINGNYQKEMEDIIKQRMHRYGLIYVDPNGIVDFESLIELTKHINMEKVDVLWNFNGTAFKRCRKAFNRNEYFISFLEKVNKKFWYVRKLASRHQWSFLFGCNTQNFKLTKSLDFFEIHSDEGNDILNQLNYTKEETDERNSKNKGNGQNKLF